MPAQPQSGDCICISASMHHGGWLYPDQVMAAKTAMLVEKGQAGGQIDMPPPPPLVSWSDALVPLCSMLLPPSLGRISAKKKVLCKSFQETT